MQQCWQLVHSLILCVLILFKSDTLKRISNYFLTATYTIRTAYKFSSKKLFQRAIGIFLIFLKLLCILRLKLYLCFLRTFFLMICFTFFLFFSFNFLFFAYCIFIFDDIFVLFLLFVESVGINYWFILQFRQSF